MSETNKQVAEAVNMLVKTCHGAAFDAGWWVNHKTGAGDVEWVPVDRAGK